MNIGLQKHRTLYNKKTELHSTQNKLLKLPVRRQTSRRMNALSIELQNAYVLQWSVSKTNNLLSNLSKSLWSALPNDTEYLKIES